MSSDPKLGCRPDGSSAKSVLRAGEKIAADFGLASNVATRQAEWVTPSKLCGTGAFVGNVV